MKKRSRRGVLSSRGLLGIAAIFALTLLSGNPAGSVGAEEQGMDRLFYSPEDRAVLEILREASSRPVMSASEPKGKEKAEKGPQVFTLGGTVTRKNGVQSVWLNGRSYSSATSLPANVRVDKPYVAGQVVLKVPETGKSYPLRPGQTVDINEGKIRESYERPPTAAAAATGTSTAAAETTAMPAAIVEPVRGMPEKP